MTSNGGFRIRRLFNVSEASYHASNRAYESHLLRIAPKKPDHAWRFFALDFFHDGPMRRWRFSDSGRRVTFDIQWTWAPSPMWFRVELDGLALLSRWVQPLAGFGNQMFRGERQMYFYAELDTLGPELRSLRRVHPTCRFHSLVIFLDPAPTFLSLIYQRLRVRPRAPRAWALLQHRSVPGLYRGPRDLAQAK
jgi:hypothetical protein